MPRYQAINEFWRVFPPLYVIVPGALGWKPPQDQPPLEELPEFEGED